ncbi:diguanylate cyclase (GGDEF)-like protein/PAS domain S-box-containing protein [Rhizobium sp. BK313]|uniref:diguanylate cyclase domain-containing protein n=1 Tax=Rhizobium sp. BK313 TaxID=2587081 RepID=UPI0010D113AC|nr:diguanylate cyclase [Rhizobium sp. BK313]MBB3454329.1 diguanylate cyclase (GGDEF)-like protein/PAS domain S-box-containing protein [Rhizobium sp. BK313]
MLGEEITAFLKASPMRALLVDAVGVITFANVEARNSLGRGGELLGTAISDLLPAWPLAPKSYCEIRDTGGNTSSYHAKVMTWPLSVGESTAVLIEPADEDRPAGLAAREATLRLRYVIEMLPEAVCVFDAKDRYVLWNEKYAELYADIAEYLTPGIHFEDILKRSLAGDDMREVVADKDEWLRERMKKFRQPVSQELQQLRDGRWLRHDDRRTPDGGAIGMRIDITQLKQREEWLHQLFDANPMPMLLCEGNSLQILEANKAAVEFYGFPEAVLLSKRACDMHVDGGADRFAKALLNLDCDCEAKTVWLQHTAAGRERHVMIYVRLLHDGSDRRLLLTIADVSERILAEAEASRLAHHDVLTGLPNRMQFYKTLDQALSSPGGGDITVCCLDLDGFKPVNDTFGHAAGDDVLKIVAQRLQTEAQGHMVARLGGDEFAILMVGSESDAVDLAERSIGAFGAAFLIKGLAICIGVSIGIATASTQGLTGEALVQEADRALYRAKAEGRNTWRTASDDRPAPGRASV